MPTSDTKASVSRAQSVKLDSLLLDDQNPRLPPSQRGKSQEDLAVYLEMAFDAFTVAESIARHGFFLSEPIIVIPSEAQGRFVAIEGNRRLTALMGLATRSLRDQFASAERWHALAKLTAITAEAVVPVVVETSRDACTPVVGFRHISGILQWKPYAQARYVASLVDGGKSYEEVHKLIGIPRAKVADLYREQAIFDQAKRLEISTGNLETSFSLLEVAMGITKLRDFVGAPLGTRFTPGTDPIPSGKVDELRELLTYIYGQDEQPPVITDSRQIAQLGNVIAEPRGLAALRSGDTLEAAKQKIADAAVDPKTRLRKRLETAASALNHASGDMPGFYADSDIIDLLDEVRAALSNLEPPDDE